MYQRYFSRLGWMVQTAQGAIECLELFQRRLPDVLVLDLRLPWGGADGLLAVMREEPELARVSVILTCSGVSGDWHSPGGALPALKPMHKPFSLGSLLETIRESSGMNGPTASWGDRLECCLDN
jgi:DNA-binding response OmpR family regulator